MPFLISSKERTCVFMHACLAYGQEHTDVLVLLSPGILSYIWITFIYLFIFNFQSCRVTFRTLFRWPEIELMCHEVEGQSSNHCTTREEGSPLQDTFMNHNSSRWSTYYLLGVSILIPIFITVSKSWYCYSHFRNEAKPQTGSTAVHKWLHWDSNS